MAGLASGEGSADSTTTTTTTPPTPTPTTTPPIVKPSGDNDHHHIVPGADALPMYTPRMISLPPVSEWPNAPVFVSLR